jgi:hypothetical protein
VRPCKSAPPDLAIFKEFCPGCIGNYTRLKLEILLHPIKRILLSEQEIEAILSITCCDKCNNCITLTDSRLDYLSSSTGLCINCLALEVCQIRVSLISGTPILLYSAVLEDRYQYPTVFERFGQFRRASATSHSRYGEELLR